MSKQPLPPLAAAIVQLVAEGERVTFADVMNLPDMRGACALRMAGNLVIWTGLSDSAADALHALLSREVVRFTAASTLDYVAAGEFPNLPVALSGEAASRGYASPHWVPMLIEPGAAWNTHERALGIAA